MSRPVKRSFSLKGHRTSISIEALFWQALREAAERKGMSLAALVSHIDETRPDDAGLSSAIRVWVLNDTREQLRAVKTCTKSAPGKAIDT